jgi:hypothetical protein
VAANFSHGGRSLFCYDRKSTFHVLCVPLITLSFVQSIAQLAASVNQLSDALNSSAHQLELMNIAQANAVQATDGLVGNIKRMNETVLSALIDINATAVRVNQTISSYTFYSNFLSLAGATVFDCEGDRASPSAML